MADPLRFRFRLLLGRTVAMGPGKADLLTALAETGSISAAARRMGMSYKRAWYLIDTMNRCFKEPVVETVKGGRGHGGAGLTTMGQTVLDHYRAMEARAAVAMAEDLDRLADLVARDPDA
jgi:molybdate transport system regulatory protein